MMSRGDAMLGLLALMPSFASACAVTCFGARRDAVLEEANAVGTAASRARLLPAPHDGESQRLFRATPTSTMRRHHDDTDAVFPRGAVSSQERRASC